MRVDRAHSQACRTAVPSVPRRCPPLYAHVINPCAHATRLPAAPFRAQTPELLQHACYTEAAILPCVREINALHKNASTNNLQAVRKKYAQEKHGSVSGIPAATL